MSEALDTNAKALKLNLDPLPYGTFAEIGGGQEVSRWFFRVGGAAGTVAKTISAYDMKVSDAIYGGGERYVSRERLRSMLEHEFELLNSRLSESRGEKSAFFVFADTVATRNFKGDNEQHGWLGLRLQHQPGAAPSEMLLHVSLKDSSAVQQQQSLGTLGVNLIFAAYYRRGSAEELLKSLMDGLTLDNLEVDVIECTGPAFAGMSEGRELAVGMLGCGLSRAVVFDEDGRMEQPSTVFRKRVLLVHRSSMKHENPELERMMAAAAARAAVECREVERAPLRLLELSVANVAGEPAPRAEVRARLDWLMRPGHAAILTNLAETFRISQYLRRCSSEPIRFVVGLDAAVTIMRSQVYSGLTGGMLEALGRMFTDRTRVDVFSMPARVFHERLTAHRVEPGFCRVPDNKAVLTLADVQLSPPAGHLLDFLRDAGWVVGVEDVRTAAG